MILKKITYYVVQYLWRRVFAMLILLSWFKPKMMRSANIQGFLCLIREDRI